jgi:hypothetical protein
MEAKYTEKDLQNAIQDIIGGMSQRDAAKRWGIPRPTLCGRLRGKQPKKNAFEPLQRLSVAQERHLCGWILVQDAAGNAPSHNQVREMAAKVAEANGDFEPIGKNWLAGFLQRNPEVKTLRGKRIDLKRVNGASTDAIQEFFRRLALPALRDIPPKHQYNMDETGLAIGQRENGLVLGSSTKKMALKKQSGLRYWTTIIECISATGMKLNPLVIFQGDTV